MCDADFYGENRKISFGQWCDKGQKLIVSIWGQTERCNQISNDCSSKAEDARSYRPLNGSYSILSKDIKELKSLNKRIAKSNMMTQKHA